MDHGPVLKAKKLNPKIHIRKMEKIRQEHKVKKASEKSEKTEPLSTDQDHAMLSHEERVLSSDQFESFFSVVRSKEVRHVVGEISYVLRKVVKKHSVEDGIIVHTLGEKISWGIKDIKSFDDFKQLLIKDGYFGEEHAEIVIEIIFSAGDHHLSCVGECWFASGESLCKGG